MQIVHTGWALFGFFTSDLFFAQQVHLKNSYIYTCAFYLAGVHHEKLGGDCITPTNIVQIKYNRVLIITSLEERSGMCKAVHVILRLTEYKSLEKSFLQNGTSLIRNIETICLVYTKVQNNRVVFTIILESSDKTSLNSCFRNNLIGLLIRNYNVDTDVVGSYQCQIHHIAPSTPALY